MKNRSNLKFQIRSGASLGGRQIFSERLRQVWLRLVVSVVMLGLLLASGCKNDEGEKRRRVVSGAGAVKQLPTEEIELGGEVFRVELAFTQKSRERGLMFRRELASDAGMLFIYSREQYCSFWMKNTLIDLDILFIRADGTVVNTAAMKAPQPGQRPGSYPSKGAVKYCLELNAGTVERLGIKAGDRVELGERIRRIMAEPE